MTYSLKEHCERSGKNGRPVDSSMPSKATHELAIEYRTAIDDLASLRVFVAVVDAGSFSGAGRRLGVVPSTISKHVAALEQRIHGQLIIRSTSQLFVTEVGQQFYERCVVILRESQLAEEELAGYHSEPQGVLRVTVPTTFCRTLAPTLISFLEKFPKVKIDVIASVETIDLIDAGIDVAIRISSRLDPGLIAIKLARNTRIYCASPAYIQRHGSPQCLAELKNHNCIVTRGKLQIRKSPADGWDEKKHAAISGNILTDSGDLMISAMLAGLGIGHVARFCAHEHLLTGHLVELFSDECEIDSYIYAVYAERRNLPLKTRVFLDHLRAHFSSAPDWSR